MGNVYMQMDMKRFIELKRAEEDLKRIKEFLNSEQLQEILVFYADESNYLIEWSDKSDEYMPSVADNDRGEQARELLKFIQMYVRGENHDK